MSFTEDIKNELCRTQLTDSCCASAECLGMLLYANRFAVDRIRLVSSSHEVRKRAQILFGALFGCELEIEGRDNALVIYDTDMIRRIYDWYGFQYKLGAQSQSRRRRGGLLQGVLSARLFPDGRVRDGGEKGLSS